MRTIWGILFIASACGHVETTADGSVALTSFAVDITPAQPTPNVDLTCEVTTPATGGSGTITYTASWTRNGNSVAAPSTTMFAGDTIHGTDVARNDVYQCTVTATDGHQSAMATSSTVTARCLTGGQMAFAANGTAPMGTVQMFAVPTGVCTITIEAGGGEGGDPIGMTKGAKMIGTFEVMPGTMLSVLVGEKAGTLVPNHLAGGGGTYVIGPNNTPMVIAGGGGSNFAGSIAAAELVGRVETSGGTTGPVARADNGAGGNIVGVNSGGGGGFLSSGAGTGGGAGYMQGGAGGGTLCSGGFGGGGGRTAAFGEGGGGGYSGGSCADQTAAWVGCGGGGSFNSGTNPMNTAGAVTGDGYVKITW